MNVLRNNLCRVRLLYSIIKFCEIYFISAMQIHFETECVERMERRTARTLLLRAFHLHKNLCTVQLTVHIISPWVSIALTQWMPYYTSRCTLESNMQQLSHHWSIVRKPTVSRKEISPVGELFLLVEYEWEGWAGKLLGAWHQRSTASR